MQNRTDYKTLLAALALFVAGSAGGCGSKPEEQTEKAEAKQPGPKEDGPQAEFDAGPAGPLGPLPAGPVAMVGGEPITLAAFRKIYDLKLKKYEGTRRPMTKRIDHRYRKSITERLIYGDVLRRESKALGVTYDPAALDELVKQDRLGARDWEKDKDRRGESDESLRELHISQLLERAILEHEGGLKVTPEEIDAEYEKSKSSYDLDVDRVRLAQIVIEHDETVTKQQAMAEAKEVYEKARASGADFAKLAEEHSDVVTRQSGGDLGIQRADRMDPQFSTETGKLKAGQLTKPFESQSGIQILKVVARWPPGPLPKEALLDQLEGVLFNRKLQEGRERLKERLAEKYSVEDRMLASLAGPKG